MTDSAPGTGEKRMAALSSVLAAVLLTAVKLVVGIKTNSLGIISEAAHSGLDLVAAVITYYAVILSAKPPDLDHPYGHGKIENVSALVETLLLVLTCAWIIYEAIKRLIVHETHIEVRVESFLVMFLAIVVDVGRSRVLSRTARKYHSQALEADALHFSSDIWTSLVVIVGLGCVYLGFPAVDPVAAITVALLVLFVSYRLGRRTIDALLDRVPQELYDEILAKVKGIEGVEEVRSMRTRFSGSKAFVDAVVAIKRTAPFDRAHRVVDDITREVRTAHPDVDIVVHAVPVQTPDESIADGIRLIAMKRGLRAPHNLEVNRTREKYHVDFDLEFLRGTTFHEAHTVTSEVETEIMAEFPFIEKVTIHIEEFQPHAEEMSDATEKEPDLRNKIRKDVLSAGQVLDCRDVTLLGSGEGYNVSITCVLSRSLTLAEVHQIVTEIESDLYRKFKRLFRVTIHAEPG